MNKTARALALVGALAITAGACGQRPTDEAAPGGKGSDFSACMVTDSGGVDDRSFNAVTWAGLQQAEEELGIQTSLLESKSNSDYTPNINQFLQQDCNLIVTVGFLMGDATKQAAKAHPKQKFAIVDYSYEKPLDNVKPLVFNTAEAAFLAGYLSAGSSETGKIATYGGQKIPTVTIFMDGFWQGAQYYNKQHDADVEVLGWNQKTQEGSFTGNFTDTSAGKQLTEKFIQQGADIVHPVAGPVGLGSVAAVEGGSDKNKLVWVDTDGCRTVPDSCGVFLSSVVKGIDVAVKDITKQTLNNNFSAEPFVGTLENDGVSLAPYHQSAGDVPAKLKQEIKQVKKDIMSGQIEITSPAQPKV